MLARVDGMGRTAWLGITMLAFWAAWPLGVGILGFLYVSGRLRSWSSGAGFGGGPGRWFNVRDAEKHAKKWTEQGMKFGAGFGGFGGGSSGNDAFDTYRKAELERLEEEQREFKNYIEQLRRARDKAEFDQFMADRRRVKPYAETQAA